jgi:ubiquitin carboxyl-terminal hydrolase 7
LDHPSPFLLTLFSLPYHTTTQLDVKGCSDIYESLRKYTGKEMLDGDNQYDAGPELGKQDAEKGVIFTKFPPVLTVHLKRFDFDLQRMV